MRIALWLTVALALVAFVPVAKAAESGLAIERTPERVAQGEYLLTGVMECVVCHSERDRSTYAYPPRAGRRFAGGLMFRALGDRAVSPNITPFALADWTDQQIYDALTLGMRPDGRKLHIEMPWQIYRALEREELFAIIVYLRTLPVIEAGPYPFDTEVEPVRESLDPNSLHRPPSGASPVARGAYLTSLAICNGCHRGAAGSSVADLPYAGGGEFRLPGVGVIRVANITPDSATGVGTWSRDAFVARFQALRNAPAVPVPDHSPNTLMPWWLYANMTPSDLGAIYDYLRTITPVNNAVTRFEPLPGTERRTINWSEQVSAAAVAP
jgi:hypothetical protein